MSKKSLGSLDDLKSLKLKGKSKKREAHELPEGYKFAKKNHELPTPPAASDLATELSDDELFAGAMRGVNTLDGGTGRQVDYHPTPPPTPKKTRDQNEEASIYMDRFLRGEMEFELEYTEEYMHGFVRELDARTFQRLKDGNLAVEANLDLHGMNSDQAYDSLLFFIKECYLQNKRCALVVTGRGLSSPGGQSILKHSIQTWLTREPLRRVVLAFCTALPKDGGTGALYVLMRKKKKSEGKVKWDRHFPQEG